MSQKITYQKIVSNFEKMIDVNTPIIYINDYDFARVDELIAEVVGGHKIVEWNPATGTTDFKFKTSKADNALEEFLRNRYTFELPEYAGQPQNDFIVLKEIQDFIEEPKIKALLALMSQRKLYDRSYETTIIIVSSVLKVPKEIDCYVSYLEIDLPEEEVINKLIKEHTEANHYEKFKDEDREKLMPTLKGMSAYEIDRMLDMAMSVNGSLEAEDSEMILTQKKQMVRKSGVLDLIDATDNINDIGGLEILKEYLKRKAQVYSQLAEANKYGVTTPKGVFLVGMPGCGKSLCAKATAATFKKPLLKMDMGSLMGKYVGESEANLRKALRIAKAAAPCILWIDEIEKAFSGVGGNNDIMTRMFGYFLSWMQEKKEAVYVFATANNAENLPPELKRKGRFDEIFCVNLPNDKERADIFKVHIKKKQKNGCPIDNNIKYEELANATKGFNGADIEAVVNEAVEECFINNKAKLTTDKLKEVAGKTKSISKSCKKQIEDMERLFDENDFTNASNNPYWVLTATERKRR